MDFKTWIIQKKICSHEKMCRQMFMETLFVVATNWKLFFFPFIFISWRLITLQYCSGFCHTLTWISHGFTCVPHPDPPSCLKRWKYKQIVIYSCKWILFINKINEVLMHVVTWMNFKIMLSISSQTKKRAYQKLFLYKTL